jgi:hypothetical protein
MNRNAIQYLHAQSHYAQHGFDYKQFKSIQRLGKIPPNAKQFKHKRIKAGGYLLSFRCS